MESGNLLPLASGKSAVKEGLVSQIASKFQQFQGSNSTAGTPKRIPDVTGGVAKLRFPPEKTPEVNNKNVLSPGSVNRTESHHARFNTARAMFEKMGSADELDERGSSASPVTKGRVSPRAASAGPRPSSRSSEEDVGNGENKSSFLRSRSTSPRSASVEVNKTNPQRSLTKSHTVENGHVNGNHQNGVSSETMGLVQSRRLSFQQKESESSKSGVQTVTKTNDKPTNNSSSVKELTNRQRNWFPSFEKGKTESVESARRTSVKNDSTPNLISGSGEENHLDLPGDRRPLSARTSTSSDSIEDYLRNWKKSAPNNEQDIR